MSKEPFAKKTVTCLCGHPKIAHPVAGSEYACGDPGCKCPRYRHDEGSAGQYLDMTVREVLDAMDRMCAGKLAFNGPGSNGEKRDAYCCAFATGYESAAKLSRSVLGSAQGLPKPKAEPFRMTKEQMCREHLPTPPPKKELRRG